LKQIAFGALSLRPDQFWRLTHGEFIAMYEGYLWREENDRKKMAQLASWITFPHLKKPLHPKKFLGEEKGNGKVHLNETSPEITKKVLGDLMDELGG
jgi:hypothetical protein